MNNEGLDYNRTEKDQIENRKNYTIIFMLHTSKSRNNLVKSLLVKNYLEFKSPIPITLTIVPRINEYLHIFQEHENLKELVKKYHLINTNKYGYLRRCYNILGALV